MPENTPTPSPLRYDDMSSMWTGDISPYFPESVYKSPKQLAFCLSTARESMYAGSSGTGKTHALAASALLYTHIGNYNSILFRKQKAAARRPGGIFDVLSRFLAPWIGTEIKVEDGERFIFPSGAIIAVGYASPGMFDAYEGLQFQHMGYDEVGQIAPEYYSFGFSRLRKTKSHGNLPLRIQSITNPRGPSKAFFRDRFKIVPDNDPTKPPNSAKGTNPDNLYIDAKLEDNPELDREDYEKSLERMTPQQRKEYRGDWFADDEAQYSKGWFTCRWEKTANLDPTYRIYQGVGSLPAHGDRLRSSYKPVDVVTERNAHKVITTIDLAMTAKNAPQGAVFTSSSSSANFTPSWTVLATWIIHKRYILLVEVVRFQAEIPQTIAAMRRIRTAHPRTKFYVDGTGPGLAFSQMLPTAGDFPPLTAEPIKSTKDKIVLSLQAQDLASQGRVVLPFEGDTLWDEAYRAELYTWTGDPKQVDDQVDVTSQMGRIVHPMPITQLLPLGPTPTCDMRSMPVTAPNPVMTNDPGTVPMRHLYDPSHPNSLRPDSPGRIVTISNPY